MSDYNGNREPYDSLDAPWGLPDSVEAVPKVGRYDAVTNSDIYRVVSDGRRGTQRSSTLGLYEQIADSLNASLRACGRRVHAAAAVDAAEPARGGVVRGAFTAPTAAPIDWGDGNTVVTDKPWCGPWEWVREGDSFALCGEGAHSHSDVDHWAVNVTCAGARCANSWLPGEGDPELFGVTLAAALAHIRSLSSDPVPDPPAEVWEMCGEEVPSGWVRWDNHAPLHHGWRNGDWFLYDTDTAKGRDYCAARCTMRGLPPLPDEAFAEAERWVEPLQWNGSTLIDNHGRPIAGESGDRVLRWDPSRRDDFAVAYDLYTTAEDWARCIEDLRAEDYTVPPHPSETA
jgi:hypothetical protein